MPVRRGIAWGIQESPDEPVEPVLAADGTLTDVPAAPMIGILKRPGVAPPDEWGLPVLHAASEFKGPLAVTDTWGEVGAASGKPQSCKSYFWQTGNWCWPSRLARSC